MYKQLVETIEFVDEKRLIYKGEYKIIKNEYNSHAHEHEELEIKYKEQRDILDPIDGSEIQDMAKELGSANKNLAKSIE